MWNKILGINFKHVTTLNPCFTLIDLIGKYDNGMYEWIEHQYHIFCYTFKIKFIIFWKTITQCW